MTQHATSQNAWTQEVAEALHRGREWLLSQQQDDGHWCGELEGDTILESEFVLLLAILGQLNDHRIPLAANYLVANQLPTGGWANYPGGPAEISVSVKAYFALKIAGYTADDPMMLRAAQVIRSLGGAEAANSFTRFYLAMLGQIPYAACPTVPVEIILLPRWFFFNIYAMSAWSRTIFVPLSIVDAFKPLTHLPDAMHIRELFLTLPERPRWPAKPTKRLLSWTNFFLGVDWLLKRIEQNGITPLRRFALSKAIKWIRQRTAGSDGLGAIFPPIVYHAIVLHCYGLTSDHPEMQDVLKQLDRLSIIENNTLRIQPCLSPVWDTALSIIGLSDNSNLRNPHAIHKAISWIMAKEARTSGDWSNRVAHVEPSGWYFEYRNEYYPDTDDTAKVLIAIAKSGGANDARWQAPIQRAIRWLLAMQNSDGGWGAFDRNVNNRLLEYVPFADHNAMLDASCPDITARILEALSHYGYAKGQPSVDRAIQFILKHQEQNGTWYGRWGVNFVYGTWQVLVGLAAVGFDMHSMVIRRSILWLKDVQNSDGGWGETCRSYDDPNMSGQGSSTASQTAWAILGLLAAAEHDSEEVRAGISFLLGQQNDEGTWHEAEYTGTGFPKVFYLKYHYYAVYFPLIALNKYIDSQSIRPVCSGRYKEVHVNDV